MAEINAMTTEEILARTRELESDIRKNKTSITRMQQEVKTLDLRIKENQEKLKMSTTLPHMVANVGEILDAEDDEEGDKDGFK